MRQKKDFGNENNADNGGNEKRPGSPAWKGGSQEPSDHVFAQNGREAGKTTLNFNVHTHEILIQEAWGEIEDSEILQKLPADACATGPRTKIWEVRV